MISEIFQRAELLLGHDAMERMAQQHVIVFGVGGVGSWCAEALARSGVGHLTIVDGDVVCESNINRQLMATTKTIGVPKVLALRERLLDINPEMEVTALHKVFTQETAADFHFDDYDYVIDAIDSLRDKALLILMATRSSATLFSSMGAALKTDPSKIKVTEFWRVEGDPLARTLRKRFKAAGEFPERKFLCVYSDEPCKRKAAAAPSVPLAPVVSAAPSAEANGAYGTYETAGHTVNGSLVHITAIFGLTLASLVVRDQCR